MTIESFPQQTRALPMPMPMPHPLMRKLDAVQRRLAMRLRRADRSGRARVEVALLCGSAALGYYLQGSSNPGSLPATLMVYCLATPILAGLMHGIRGSLWTFLLPLLVLRFLSPNLLQALSTELMASGLLALIAGQLTDVRSRALAIATSRITNQRQQLEKQYRTEQVLRASHAQLAERCIAQGWSVEANVAAAISAAQEGPLEQRGAALLALLESQAMVRAAALYMAPSSKPLDLKPLCISGPLHGHPSSGPLHGLTSRHNSIQMAFRSKQLVAPPIELNLDQPLEKQILLAVPLITSDGQALGVLAVHDLPFIAIHDVHFNFIATLVNAFADTLAASDTQAKPASLRLQRPVASVPPPMMVTAPPPPLPLQLLPSGHPSHPSHQAPPHAAGMFRHRSSPPSPPTNRRPPVRPSTHLKRASGG